MADSKKKYRIAITMTQETDGQADDNALVEDFSSDKLTHAVKTQVFTECFTEAVNEAVKKLTNMVIAEETGGKPGR